MATGRRIEPRTRRHARKSPRDHAYAGKHTAIEAANGKTGVGLVRGQIIDNKVFGARVVHSEGNGVYDKVSVQMANGMDLDAFTTGSRLPPSVIVHVLIYQLPKGEHAFCLAQNDTVGDANLIYSRSIRMRYLGWRE